MNGAVAEAKRWYWQRVSAMALAFFVLVHLATMVYAVRGGLSAAEILARTRGSWLFGGFYVLFVAAVTVHASLGLATIAEEWGGIARRKALLLAGAFALVIAILGLRAVYGVVIG